jgi:hypothetical protein
MLIMVILVVMPCSSAGRYQHFTETDGSLACSMTPDPDGHCTIHPLFIHFDAI